MEHAGQLYPLRPLAQERILKIDSGMSMDYYMPKKGNAPDLLTTDEMFKTETLILQDLAAGESCVVAGRSGFHVFRLHYVKKYTGTSRYDTRNYQLVIAADGKTEEQMAAPGKAVRHHQ